MYNPIDDIWVDGVPLTSGRSGLASAVIYQPSCPQNYSQECLVVQHSANREYDDDRKSHGGHGGGSSSMHYNYSSNLHSKQRGSSGGSGNQRDCGEQEDICDETEGEHLTKNIVRYFAQIKVRCKERCCATSADNLNHHQKQEYRFNQHSHSNLNDDGNNNNREGILINHTRCKGLPCPIQKLKRKFQHFINNRKQCINKRRNEKQ